MKYFTLSIYLLWILPDVAAAQNKTLANEKPNIVFILADDMGYNDLACYQNPYVHTPNIDALATGGWKFTQAYVNAPNCAPSRACLLTGMFTPKHGIYTVGESARGSSANQKFVPVKNITVLDTSFLTFAEPLTGAGYECISIGKWHLGEGAFAPTGQGFSENIGGTMAGTVKSHFAPYITPMPNLGEQPGGKFLADALSDKAIQYIAKKHNSPFFLYLPFYSVHSPVQAPDSLIKKCKTLIPPGAKLSPVYAAMIENLDENVGRVVAAVNAAGIADNTLIIFFSDNGPVLNYTSVNLKGEKGQLYEGGIREPLILNWKHHLNPGRVITDVVMAADFYPSFMALAGVPENKWPKELDGHSMLPLLNGGHMPAERPIVWHFPAYLESNSKEGRENNVWRETPASAIRFGNWKLVKHYITNVTELYNIADDPQETHDMAAANSGKVKQLQEMLDAYLKKTNAFIPTKINLQYVPPAISN